MPAAGVVTLVLVLVTVAALAAALVRVATLLKHVNFTLGTIIAGVRAIELATRPINPDLGDIAGELEATQGALDNLLAAKAAEAQRVPVYAATARRAPRPAPVAKRAPAPEPAPIPAPAPNGNGPLLVSRLPQRGA
jgi:hypothetical protein